MLRELRGLADFPKAGGVSSSDEGYRPYGQVIGVNSTEIRPCMRSAAPILPNFNGFGGGAMAFRRGGGKL
jgi:hypothetical protein